MSETGEVTRLLREMRGGNDMAASQLLAIVYRELRRVAAGMMKHERPGHTLQPTAVVHEAYIRLIGAAGPAAENHAHFFALAARAMRQVLVDHARKKLAEKRGGPMRIREELVDDIALTDEQSEEVLAVHEALTRLQELDARQAQIVEMHYFAGNSVEEIAAALNVSERSVKRELQTARVFFRHQLERSAFAADA